MSLYDAIEDLLIGEGAFAAAMEDLLLAANGAAKVPKVLRSMRPVRSIGQEHFPCWVMEVGDTTTTDRSIGSCCQGAQQEVLLALVWHQQDPDAAFAQRAALWDALVGLFLRNPSPDGAATVYVDAMASDRAANHPTHITTFRLLADVETSQ